MLNYTDLVTDAKRIKTQCELPDEHFMLVIYDNAGELEEAHPFNRLPNVHDIIECVNVTKAAPSSYIIIV